MIKPTNAPDLTDDASQPKRAVLIVNTKSRRGKEWFPQVDARLRESNVELLNSWPCKRPQDVFKHIKDAVKEEVPYILVGGGDGTLSSAMTDIVGSKSVLGVIPLGTGNAFARDLGIQASVDAASDVIANGKVCAIDLGMVHGRYFVNVATVGLTTRIAEQLTDEAKRRLGRFVYAFAIMRALSRVKPFRSVLTTDAGRQEFDALQFVVSSGRFHAGPFPVTPEAHITDCHLNGYILEGRTKGPLFRYALSLWGGRQVNLPEVYAFSTTKGRLETTPRKLVTVDGEISERTPLEFKVAPRAAKVLVPQTFEG